MNNSEQYSRLHLYTRRL